MAGNAAEFLISIEQQLKGDDAVSALDKAESSVKDAIAAYKQLESTTTKTATALDKATASLGAAEAKLSKMKEAGAGASAIQKQASAVKGLADAQQRLANQDAANRKALGAQKAAASNAADNLVKVRKASEQTGIAGRVAGAEVFKLKEAFTKLGSGGGAVGKLFEVGDAFKQLASGGGGFGLLAGGAAIAVSAVALLTTALVGLVAAGLKAGIALANAARNTRLTVEAMLGSKDAANAMLGSYREINKATGATNERLMDLTKQLQAAKVPASDIPTALRAIATQEQAIGQDGTAQLIENLKSGKSSAAELGAQIEKQYGGIVKQKMMGLDQQVEQLKGNFAALFSGLDIEPFLAAFSQFVSVFDSSTAMGQVLKGLFETIFQPLAYAAADVFPYIHLFISQFINTALKMAVAVKPAATAILGLFNVTPSDAISMVMTAAKVAAVALAIAIGVVVAALLLVAIAAKTTWDGIVVAINLVMAGVQLFQEGLVAVGQFFLRLYQWGKTAWDGIVSGVNTAIDTIKGISLESIGTALIDGLVAGLKKGADAVGKTVDSVGATIKSGFKSALGISSPSKVFAEYGAFTAEGFALGLEDGAAHVDRALSNMMSGQGEDGAAAARSGAPITINNTWNISIDGAKDPHAVVDEMRSTVRDLFEEIAIELGGGPEVQA